MPMDIFLLRQFQHQIEHQCHAALLNAALLQNALDNRLDQEVIWAAIQGILTATANLSKAFWGQRGSLEQQREDLRLSLQVEATSVLRPTSMRNNFDHFDERLDKWWAESTHHNHIDYIVGPENMIGGADPKDIFRHFNPETGDVIFWGDRYSLVAIIQEINHLLPIVAAEAAKPHWVQQEREEGASGT
jgi:hypothetical protein